MAAKAGRRARIRQASATFTTSTNETADVSTNGLEVQVVATGRRHWNPASTTYPLVYRGAGSTLVGSSEYAVNYVRGLVTFATAQSTSLAFDMDVEWATASFLAGARSWEASVDVEPLDVTTMSTGSTGDTLWRKTIAGLSESNITLDRLFVHDSTTDPVFFDDLNLDTRVLLELWPASTGGQEVGKYEAWAWVDRDTLGADVGDPVTEAVSFIPDGQVYYSTG